MAWTKLTKVITGVSATVIAGGAILTWTGKANLDNVSSMYDTLYNNYQNALTNIGTYRTVLEKRLAELQDMNAIKEQLLAECNEKDAKISELEAQIEELQTNGTEEDQELIASLQEELSALQEDYNATVEELNTITAKYNELNEQLVQANADAQALEDEIAAKDAAITDTAVLTEDQIDSGEDYKLYLTFATASNTDSGVDLNPVITYLNNLKLWDLKRESPIQLHGTYYNASMTQVYINNVNAYNMIVGSAKTVSSIDGVDDGLYSYGGMYQLILDGHKYIIYQADDNTWMNTFHYTESDNGTK